jgi:hypothetical protein
VLTIRRLQLLLRLDLTALDDAASDPYATVPSVAVGIVSMFLFGIGGWLWWLRAGLPDARGVFLSSAVIGTVFALALWLVWLLAAFALVGRFTSRPPRIEAMARACGLAAAPLALGLLMAVPVVSFAAGIVALAAWVLLTQAAIERSTGARPGVVLTANLAGFTLWAGVMSVLATPTQRLAPGPFLADSIWEAAVVAVDAGQAALETPSNDAVTPAPTPSASPAAE